MVKSTNITVYLCSECGSDYPKWHGKCPTCNEWGTLKEFSISKKDRQKRDVETRPTIPLVDILYHGEIKRNPTGISEIDRVLGGGFLPGSVVLLGGNPGIGKSTLALQMVAKLKDPVLYVSAEENEEQIALRSKRLGINSNNLNLTSE
ncbi:MAG: AAA family ATPase, partial [Candidatus Marinimicrobia bacterium]|nr:AAA family ATPase [Candidatus Neomarinimicrobiota bacterium]